MESSERLQIVRKEDYSFGDLEKIRLTSKAYSVKKKNPKYFCTKSFFLIFLLITFIQISFLLFILPFLSNIKNIIVREMAEQYGSSGLNQSYERVNPKDEKYTYIPIVGTDDIHGNFFPKINKIKIGDNEITYKTGGLEYVTKYINILREEFGSNRVLYFDGGDFYQGGIDSVLFDGEIMQDYFNLIGVNGTTIGNHEFDYSRKWIESKIKKAKYKTLINNIMDSSKQRKSGALGKNQETSHLYEIILDNGDSIKIGVIGLSFNMKNDKTIPNTWGNRNTWDNIQFFSYIEELEEESNKLRKNGANAVIALSHFGLVCNQALAMKLDMYNK